MSSESSNPNISIFPLEKVNAHFLDKSLPEFLRPQDNQNPTTYQDFFKKNQGTLSFLERNQIENNPFKIQAESFEFHFQQLKRLYSAIDESSTDSSHLMNLLRYERNIHDICEFSSTQDVSFYLKVLQRIFDDENLLCELISLMNKKHVSWDDNFSPAYLNWIHFLTPFIHYIHTTSKTSDPVNFDERIKDCLEKLDKSLVAKELGKKFTEIDPKDHQAIKQEILSLKKNPNLTQIKDYYYVLGVCVLLQSLMNPGPNFGFMRLCVQIAIYSNKLYQFRGKGIEERIGPTDFNAFRIEGDFYIAIIKQLLSINKGQLELQKQILLDSLYVLATKDLCEIKHCEGSLLEEIADFIMENHHHQQTPNNWLIDNNEYLLWSYLSIIKHLFEKSDSSSKEREQLCLIISNKLPLLMKPENSRRILTLDVYYYHLQRLVARENNEKATRFQKNLNLSETPLQDLISSCHLLSEEDLLLNLKYSLGAILKSTKFSLLRNEIFEEKLKMEAAKNNPNLKYILIFLAKIQTHKLPGDSEETDHASSSLLKLLALINEISHQLNVWDMLNLQRVLCSALSSSSVSGEEPVKKLMQLFVEKIAEAQVISKSFFSRCEILIIKDKQSAASNFISFCVSSVQDIRISCDDFWQCGDRQESLALDKNKFVNFVQSWTESILETINLVAPENSAFESLQTFSSLLSHPSLNLVCTDSERDLLNKTLLRILEASKQFNWPIKNLETNLAKISELLKESALEVQNLPIANFTSNPNSLHFSVLLQSVRTSAYLLQNLAGFQERIQQLPQQDFENLVQSLSNLFDSSLICAQANSIDFHLFEDFMTQNLSKITSLLLKPLLVAKEKISTLESFFDKLFFMKDSQSLTNYHILAFLSLTTEIEKISPEDDKNMIFKFVLRNPKLWSFLMNSLKLLIKHKKERLFMSQKLKGFITHFEELFRIEIVDTRGSKIALSHHLGYSLPIDQVIRDLIVSLNSEFESFRLFDMLALNNKDLNTSFTSILEIYEKSIYFYGKMNAILIQEIQRSIQDHDLALIRYRKNTFGDTGYAVEAGCMGSLFGDEEEEEEEIVEPQEEVLVTNQQARDEKEKQLMDEAEAKREKLREIQKFQIEEIKAKISEKIQEFGIVFPFKSLAETFKPYQKSCLSIILQSLDNLFKEILGGNYESFLREPSEGAQELPRIQTTDDTNSNQIITLDLYLNFLLKFLAHYQVKDEYFKSEQFIWNLYSVTTLLFANLLKQSPQQINVLQEELNFTQLFQNLFDAFVSYFAYKFHHLKEKLTSEQSQRILEWVQIFFKTSNILTIPAHSFLLQIINLIQITLKSEPQTSCSFLINHPEILKTILCSTQTQPWSLDLTKEISFIFTTFLQSSLPNEQGVVLKLNQLLTKNSFSLRTFANNPIIQQQETLSTENLVSILENYYEITISPTAQGQSEFTPDNIMIRFDPTKVTKTLEETVSDIISSMSFFSKNILDTLIISLVENYCYNLNIISEETKKPLKREDFRETSSIFTILTTLFQSYPQALVYAALHKKDYHEAISSKSFSFLKDKNLKELTFFECLFEINYFSSNDTDMLALTKILCSLNSGVLFSENQKTKDICEVLVYDFMTLINKNLQQKPSEMATTSSWDTLERCLFIFTAAGITYEIQQYSTFTDTWKALIRSELKSLFNTLLENLLAEIGFLVKNYYSLTNKWSYLDVFLYNLIQKCFNQSLQDLKLSVDSFDSLKVDHYISFLQSTSQESQTFSLKLLQKLSFEQSSAPAQESYHQYVQNDTINLPFEESANTFAPEEWKSKITVFDQNLKPNDSLIKNLTFYKTNTAFPLVGQREYSSKIPGSKLPQWQISGQSTFVDITLKCHEILNKKMQAIHSPKPNQENQAGAQEVDAPKPTTITVEDLNTNPTQSTSAKIHYFLHPTLQNYAEFLSIKSRVIMLLKDMTERVLVAQFTNLDPHQDSISLIEIELKSSLKNLTEFESNLLFSLVDQFEALMPYTPNIKNFTGIQQELSWIEGNFDSYLKELNILRGTESVQANQDPSNPQTNLEYPMTSNATFCTTSDSSSEAPLKKAHPTKSQQLDPKYDALKEFDFSDDKIIESLQAFFFVKYSSDNIYSSNSNMMAALEYLCYSPKFEIKLFDLFFFILYCPESIKSPQNTTFPIITKLLNADNEETLKVVVTHILRFFNNYLPKKPAIIYQPRIFLEQFGFKPLEKFKADNKFYQQQISSKISILDLIIGLLDVPDLQQNHQNLIFSCINALLQKNDALQIVESQHLNSNQETLRVLTTSSCNLMAKHENLQSILFQLPDFVLYNWKNVIQTKFEDQLDLMYHPVKDLNSRIKLIISSSQGEPTAAKVLDELKAIKDLHQKFEEMEKRLDLANFILIKILLRKKESPSSPGDDAQVDYSQKAMKSLGQILTDPLVQEFFIHLFELASYLLDAAIDADQSAKQLKLHVLFLCIHFYTLLCIQEMARGLEKAAKTLPQDSSTGLPTLPSLVSKESIDELKHVPELENTFSYIIRENKFDFDILFANLCKKYQTVIANHIFQKINLKKQFTIICRRIPWCLDFVTKKRLLADNLARSFREQGVSTSQRNIYIDREEFLKTTFKAFLQQTKKDLGRPIRINYVNEHGYDAGGLTRDFFTNITGELFDSRIGLFQLSPNQTNIQPGIIAKTISGHLKYMELAGILLAKAIQQDCTMDLNFTKSFLKQILKRRILLDDLEDYDSDLAKNLKWMLNNSVEGLEQPFTFENQAFDQNSTIELLPNGYDIIVDDENKNDFVARVCEMKMHRQISDEIKSFLKGFYHVMPVDALDIFSASEFQLLIAGIPTIDVEEMKKTAIFNYFTNEIEYLKDWLWEILLEFSQKELAAFLFFVSGSLKPPGGGFSEKPIRFRYMGDQPLKLPIAHTCSWEIEIAKYASREDFKHKLLIAIFDGQGSFMIS